MTAGLRWTRVAAGDYEALDGRFRLYRLIDVHPPAWNIEDVTFDAIVDTVPGGDGYDGLVVDGAATKRDAIALARCPKCRMRLHAPDDWCATK